ncbi:mannose-1-phosphate guanylyltransferase/mannose-6-phosphate isomerase [Pectobacterium atrosepticum]|uniref:mannose-1-phosphate guanylyltransferase/mannose-6-phosphate isomerase n=1 Tax=Pectobacterium TaxID=122277 RepID=UPI000CDEAFD3|nr:MULTISPECIES: mannose-1-phosphate guanylyltransferase/mannose-6-phosphate isomerase [Pectobacterium]MBA0164177.1 mannose-1-phosphate guanylyltransferase/mannose-6-phosphate isomerase [Pectobacterium versatile]MBA0170274.1 mannose-1-phosphate guanylyltransferase/mannose-6-phosphate isomerase [Pectobacterium versatile]MBD0845823.1 mannose-1-phosphate guanyltransferase [Pectobacterium carotovorum subsp. carotovorum]MBK4825369.1 Mannose-1-phosphate guanylyltransferase [Pectobacterium carotovorum
MILPVIMAGGSGSRLWPLSRTLYPKQFLSLISNLTMLQDTVMRLRDIEHKSPLFICNEAHRFIVAEQLRQKSIKHSGIILEPVGRNTAPAIALAALQAIQNGDDPILLVLAADHAIQNEDAFVAAVSSAITHASKGKLVTFGIVPNRPETGYGYIRRGSSIESAFTVASFVEKPDAVSAQNYLDTGEYYWNSGMFMFKASRYLKELECHSPEIYNACSKSIEGINKDLDFIRLDSKAFHICPDDSIDYAVMEKTSDAVVVPMDASWSDVGSWSALWDIAEKDKDGNAIRGDVLTEKTNNSYIYSQNKLVATVGIDNLIVVETKDAVLVANKDSVQDVKAIVEKLKRSERCEYLQHREVFRPWGSHDQIAEGERYHVKRVVVKPGERTATQLHYHRAEHWVVVSGTAKVHRGDEVHLVSENESIYIPIGTSHAIENPGKVMLEIIEVRSGAYLGEDDVLRVGTISVGY